MYLNTSKYIIIENRFIRCLRINHPNCLRLKWLLSKVSDFSRQDHNPPAVNRARLKVGTREWLACKLVPKVYGNKIDIESDSIMSEELRKLSADLEVKYTRDY